MKRINITGRDVAFFVSGIITMLAIFFVYNRKDSRQGNNHAEERK